MDFSTPLADATTPVADAYQPATTAATEQPVGQSLGGEFQAPSPTEGTSQSFAPDPTLAAGGEQITLTRAEYEQLQAELNSSKGMLDEIKSIAQQQREAEEQRQFAEQLRGMTMAEYQKAMDAPSVEEGAERIYNFLTGQLDTVTQNYQQTLQEYEQEVQSTFWNVTKPGFAGTLMEKYGLPESAREALLAEPNDRSMDQTAARMANQYQVIRAQMGQNFAGKQVEQLRNNGAVAIGGEGSQVPQPKPEPGTSREDLRPGLARALGITLAG